jgi:TP901 family phage tail tape measure protein
MIGGGAQKITIEIGGKIGADLARSLQGAQRMVSSFGRNVTRSLNDAATAGSKGFKGILRNDLWQAAAAGAASIGVGLAASVRVAADYEKVLTEIGKTANASGSELKGISKDLLALSGRNRTNLGPAILAEGVQDLVAQGLELNDAVASIETLGRVATATNSNLLDVTKTGFQLQNALKIRPTELKATFDALAFAGKAGAFELKDMAQFMPTIAAAAGTLGIQGKQGAIALASMMQMVRKDAPDAGQATTRLTDAMLKMTAPDAVKNFKKFGVNIEQVLKNARKKGVNPMEAALDELQRVTGGDAFKLSQIFGDKEAKLGLMSLMKYRKEYEKLKADAGGSAAAGSVDKDYQRQIQTFSGTLASFQNSSQRLGITLGNALLPPLTRIAEAITPLVEKFAAFAEKNPGITTGIVVMAGAFAGLIVALPVIAGVISAIGTIGTAIGAVTAAIPALAGIGTVLAVAGGPITLIIAGIVGIGAAIYALVKNWGAVKQAGVSAWAGVQAAWGRFTSWIGNVFNQALGVIRAWGPKVLAVMFPIPAMIIRLFSGSGIGEKIITAIINGLKAKAGELFGWIRGTWSKITGFFGGGGRAPAAPAGAGAPAPAGGANQASPIFSPPGRATGGPVRAGQPYIVGERRRELFMPGMDGAIIPKIARPVTAGALAALMSAQPAVSFAPQITALAQPPQIAAPAAPPVSAQVPLPPQPRAAAPVTIHAPVTINAAGGNALEIRRQVELAFMDIQREIESSHRVLLND